MSNIEVQLDEIAAAIYDETRDLYEEIAPQLKNGAAQGYKVLYGRPLVQPPVFFLGMQVGAVATSQRGNEQKTWPLVTEYAVADWPLAQRLREIYEIEFLSGCTGSNVNFFRARNDAEYQRDVPADVRDRCEGFSRGGVWRLIKAIKPEKVVVIGFQVLEKLRVARQFVSGEEGVKRGNLWGIPAIAVWHFTGFHMTTEQREVIRRALREFAGTNTE